MKMKLMACVIATAVTTAVAGLAETAIFARSAAAGAETEASLYSRLGGYDGISAVVSDLLPRLMKDPALGRFWAHRGADGLAREKQLVIDFIVSRAGGPLNYPGREMKESHVGMRITEADWAAFKRHLAATLEAFKVPEHERAEVIAFMDGTKADILD